MDEFISLRSPICLCLSLLLFTGSALASEPGLPDPPQDDRDDIYEVTAPKDVFLSTLSVSLSAAGLVLDYSVDEMTRTEVANLEPARINPFDRSATEQWSPAAGIASDVTLITMTALPLAFVLQRFVKRDTRLGLTLLLMYAEAMGLTYGVTSIIKGAVQRERPYLYNDRLTIDERLSQRDPRLSFISGHTSLAFCSATFLSAIFSDLHPESPWRFVVWPVALSAASATGALRFAAGKHFPTDILGGAAVGILTGILVPALHRNTAHRVSIYPVSGEVRGIGATVAF